ILRFEGRIGRVGADADGGCGPVLRRCSAGREGERKERPGSRLYDETHGEKPVLVATASGDADGDPPNWLQLSPFPERAQPGSGADRGAQLSAMMAAFRTAAKATHAM